MTKKELENLGFVIDMEMKPTARYRTQVPNLDLWYNLFFDLEELLEFESTKDLIVLLSRITAEKYHDIGLTEGKSFVREKIKNALEI